MRSLLLAAETPLRGAATDPKVKVIIVRVTPRGLVKHPSRAQYGFRRAFLTGRVAQKTRLEIVRTEEPFHPRLVVHDERADEVPVARFIERMDTAGHSGETEGIEAHPSGVARGETTRIAREEQQVRVASGPMTSVARMRATPRG
jgi:hypothetical protein